MNVAPDPTTIVSGGGDRVPESANPPVSLAYGQGLQRRWPWIPCVVVAVHFGITLMVLRAHLDLVVTQAVAESGMPAHRMSRTTAIEERLLRVAVDTLMFPATAFPLTDLAMTPYCEVAIVSAVWGTAAWLTMRVLRRTAG